MHDTKKYSIYSWMVEYWPISTPFLALYLIIVLILFPLRQNFALFLIWIQTPIYFLHQFEEYICPGGFVEYFNRRILGSNKKQWPLTKRDAFWINVPIIFIGFPLSAILSGEINISIGIWTAYFSFINAFSHLIISLRTGYNPGLIVSILLNIPVAVYTIYYFAANKLIHLTSHIIGALIAIAIQGLLMVYGLKFLKTVKNFSN